jgi:hypothetical protein
MTADVVVVTALVLVPGLGAAFAFAPPGGISIESRIALTFGFGYALAAGAAIVLALAHVFHRPTFIAAVVVATGAMWTLALRRASPRAHVSALRLQAREAPFAVAVSLALLLVVAAAWIAQSAVFNLERRSAWRYWADGLEIAAAGHIPPESRQWGMELPTTVSKVALNAFEGGVSFLIGPQAVAGMHAILLVAAVGLVAALLALGRELGLGIFSPLVPALVVLVPKGLPLGREMSYDLTRYTAENVGRMAAFCAVVAAIYAWRAEERRAPTVIAGGLLAIAALTHAIPTSIAGVILAFYALGAVLVDRRRLRGMAVRGIAVVAIVGVVYVGVVGLSRGQLGFEGATRATFTGFPPNIDPTRSFSQGEYAPPVPKHGHFVTPPRRLLAVFATTTLNLPGAAWSAAGALAALFVATVLLVWRNRSLAALAAAAWGLFVTLVGAAFFFSYRYKTQIPGHFGLWRLYDYDVLVPGLLIPAVLQEGTKPLRGGRGIIAAILAVLVGALVVIAALLPLRQNGAPRRGAAGLEVIARVASVVPCDVRVVANARTAGFWEATTGRRALTEGRAPFLQPEVLARVLTVLNGATKFFDDPSANRTFLARERVDYIVVVSPGIWFGWGGTGRAPMPDDAGAVAALPNVQTAFRNGRVAIFAVGSKAAEPNDGQPRRCPL